MCSGGKRISFSKPSSENLWEEYHSEVHCCLLSLEEFPLELHITKLSFLGFFETRGEHMEVAAMGCHNNRYNHCTIFFSTFDFGKVYRQIDPNVSAPETICNETNLMPPLCHEIWHREVSQTISFIVFEVTCAFGKMNNLKTFLNLLL